MNVKQLVSYSFRLNEDVINPVSISKMNKLELSKSHDVVKKNQCFKNCFNLAFELGATYILGVCVNLVPFEHTWLKIGDKYIDPTLEVVLDDLSGEYYAVAEFETKNLINVIEKIKVANDKGGYYPPCLDGIRRLSEFENFFDMRNQLIQI